MRDEAKRRRLLASVGVELPVSGNPVSQDLARRLYEGTLQVRIGASRTVCRATSSVEADAKALPQIFLVFRYTSLQINLIPQQE
jgi:hypothetical protein